MELQQLFDRTVAIRQTSPSTAIKQRMTETAQSISKAGDNQARVELLNEAVLALTTALYVMEGGRPVNIDHRTHRIVIAKPWGSAGWKKWGLRYWEGAILRKILIVRCEMKRVPPLFDFGETNQWYLNAYDYPRLELALGYWKANPIRLSDWHLFADAYREEAQQRMERRRASGSL
jgi:hypothetical protein